MKRSYLRVWFVALALLVAAVGVAVAASPHDGTPVNGDRTAAATQTAPTAENATAELERFSYDVSALSVPESSTQGDRVTVTAEITNPSEFAQIQLVELRVQGELVEARPWALNPGETEEISFELDTGRLEPGSYVVSVLTDARGETAPHEVLAAPDGETASVTFENQSSDGTTVVVDRVTVPDGGFVAIHDASLLEGNVVGSVIGVSDALDPGPNEDVSVELFAFPGADASQTRLNGSQTLIAMPHLDTNGNGAYDFVTSNGLEDGPYLDENGAPVVDSAFVEVENGPERTPTGTVGPTESPTGTVSPTESPTGTVSPTESPTETVSPTESPTETVGPTESPTGTVGPTESPTGTVSPTEIP
jgi:hypothetical protein